jgi:hypothetical protein
MTSGLDVAHAVSMASDAAVNNVLIPNSRRAMHRQRAALAGSGPHPDRRRTRAREIPRKES